MTVIFFGNTAVTPLGRIDMVPLDRRLDGDMAEPLHDFERDGGILALHARGVPLYRISKAFKMSAESVNDILAGRRTQRVSAPLSRSDKYDRQRSVQDRRYAQRVLIDGRLVHPFVPGHGENRFYTGYGCRCVPCSDAHTIARQRSYVKEVAA